MADPLSVITSVVSICSAAVRASTAVVDLVQTIKDAPREIQTILTDMNDFKGVVSNLNLTLQGQMIQDIVRNDEGLADAIKSVTPPLTTCATELNRLKTKIAKNLKPAKDNSQQRINSTTWLWRKTDVIECMSRLQSNKLNLNIALSSVVSYCTLRSYNNDPRNINLRHRRNSTDTDAGSALQQYAASMARDTSSNLSREESPPQISHADQQQTIGKQLYKLLREKDANSVLMTKLVEQDVDINRTGADGRAALHVAAEEGEYVVTAFLLHRGADPNIRSCESLMEDDGELVVGETPLHLATREGHGQIIRLLIVHGADINAPNLSKFTPLEYAIIYSRVEAVKIFVENNANLNEDSEKGITPLHSAVWIGDLEVIQLLVEGNADIEAWTKDMHNPSSGERVNILMFACLCQRENVLLYLAESGAKIDARGQKGEQAIHVASTFGGRRFSRLVESQGQNAIYRERSRSILSALLDVGADIEATTEDEWTPLIKAASSANLPGMEFLLSRGANVDARDIHGHDFLWHAREWDRRNVDRVEQEILHWLDHHRDRAPPENKPKTGEQRLGGDLELVIADLNFSPFSFQIF